MDATLPYRKRWPIFVTPLTPFIESRQALLTPYVYQHSGYTYYLRLTNEYAQAQRADTTCESEQEL